MLFRSIIIVLAKPLPAGVITMIPTDRNFNTSFYDHIALRKLRTCRAEQRTPSAPANNVTE